MLASALTAAQAQNVQTVQQADAALVKVAQDRTAMARATRDLRYWSARRASAQLRELDPASALLQFGGCVTFDREDGRRQTFRIVGEDEADPAKGSVSYVSPVAQALLGKGVGDTAMVAGGEVEIVAIG
jgi:transcription elongation GreA/GreB family factor